MARTKAMLLYAIIFLCITAALGGQSDRATITGTLKDVASGVVPGVEDHGVHNSLAFDSDGHYVMTLRMEFFNVLNRHTLADPNKSTDDNAHLGLMQDYGGIGGRVGQYGALMSLK